PAGRRPAPPTGPRRAHPPLRQAAVRNRIAAPRLPPRRGTRPQLPRLHGTAPQLRPRFPARAVPDQPGRGTPQRTRRIPGRGRPALGRRARRPRTRPRRRPEPSRAQPCQPPDPADHHPHRPRPDHRGSPGPLRPSPVAGPPPAAPGRQRSPQPVVPRIAGLGCPHRIRGVESSDRAELAHPHPAHHPLARPYGRARTPGLEKALDLAIRGGATEEDVFHLRMSLTEAYKYGGEPARAMTTFTRCLTAFDADPARYGPEAHHRLLWQFKWIIAALTDFPEIPLDRTYALLDDMERRYRESGYSLHPVHGLRCQVARHIGDVATADAEFERWRTAPQDESSDCAGCVPTA